MTDIPTLSLPGLGALPQIGMGTWQIPDEHAADVVRAGIDAGYRLIDTATIYDNEEGVGRGIAASGLARDEIFVTTKVWNHRHGTAGVKAAVEESLQRLGVEYLDLYLIHWPVPQNDRFVETWGALADMQEAGLLRAIGVSNFTQAHLERLIREIGVTPAVNQIELHPRFQQHPLRAFHQAHGIVTESWGPLGRGSLIEDPRLGEIARKHSRTTAQIVLRWHIENGLLAIPKSTRAERLRENIAVFDFQLDAEDMAVIAEMDDPSGRTGPDPETFGA